MDTLRRLRDALPGRRKRSLPVRPIAIVAGAGAALLAAGRLVRGALSADRSERSPRSHTYVLERSELVAAPRDHVFGFFQEPANLAKITPPGMGFEIVDVQNMPMQRGTKIEYQIRVFGAPQRWSTEIVEYEPTRRFVDLQTRGPYRYWRHEHTFEDADGHTLVRDRVEYQMPFGPLGRLANRAAVARQLRRIFDYRTSVISGLFGGPPGEPD